MIKTEKELAENEQSVITSIRKCLASNYGISGELARLPGENMNFLSCDSSGVKRVVKVAADDQSPAFVEMEFQVLRHASQRLEGVHLPQIIENKFGNVESSFNAGDNDHKRLRIIKYLSGALLDNSDISDNIRFNVGKTLAEFDLAVRDFDHPAAHRKHRWDLTRAGQYRPILEMVEDVKKKALLAWAFEQYKKIDARNIKQVNWQFIHGDANPENILVKGEQVVGLLDFGDSCYNPRICELAICLPYLMMDQDDPLAAVKPVIDGYQSLSPLSEQELNLLWPLVLGRLATTISMATQRRLMDPDHPNWFVSEARAWSLLGVLKDLRNFNM